MTSLTELTDIIRTLDHNSENLKTGLLQKKIMQLELQYSNMPTLSPLFKMMQSLRKYLESKKGLAHPDSIPVLLSVADQFEHIIYDPDFDPVKDKTRITRIISGEIQKYKALQNKINSKPISKDMDLNNLKAVILAIDWEISDSTIQQFDNVVKEFLSAARQNKLHYDFIRIIQSLGSYIGSRKANAHPEAISILHTVFDDFEKVIQTPGMPDIDKKEILGRNIDQFHELKAKISNKKIKFKPDTESIDENFFQPALSHIKPVAKTSTHDVMPLTTLPEPDESELMTAMDDVDDIKPALSDKKKPSPAPRDIMGDLFSLKESPADELLDAIHLMDIHGPDKGRAPQMQSQEIRSPSSGIKEFTPRLKNNEPIPEIENRLDEFFNLETPSKSSAPKIPVPEETVELITEPEEDKTEGIVPFQYEDESMDPGDAGHDDQSPAMRDIPNILSRLKASLETLDRLKPEPVLSSIKSDLSNLKTLFKEDAEKYLLLEMVILCLCFVENKTTALTKAEETGNHQKEDVVSGKTKEKTPGIFARIKAIFTS